MKQVSILKRVVPRNAAAFNSWKGDSVSPKRLSKNALRMFDKGLSSFALAVLRKLRKRQRLPWAAFVSRQLQRVYETSSGPVTATLHGFSTQLNAGNSYPFIVDDVLTFNSPLVELVNQVYRSKGRSLKFADVGAATGDTVLLLKERCSEQIRQFVCFEGDNEFFKLLELNTARFQDVQIVQVVLASHRMKIRSLVKHHRGTASAIGHEFVEALDLDSIDPIYTRAIDVLKIDVDGYDGEVIQGAKQILTQQRPAVIFEWHPKLISDTATDPFLAFKILADCGYTRFLWFNNVGTFSHFSGVCHPDTLKSARDYLLAINKRADEHFDVVALPADAEINEIDLAAMEYARSQR